jgi:hypothetical protein
MGARSGNGLRWASRWGTPRWAPWRP